MSPFLNVEEAAQYLRLSPNTLRTYVQERKLPFRKHGRRVVFRVEDLDSWSQARKVEPSVSKFQEVRSRLRSLKTEYTHAVPIRKGAG